MSVTAWRRMAGVAVVFSGVLARAADGTWTGAVDGAWSNAANWRDGAVASGAGFVAALDALAGPVQITNDVTGLKLKGLVAKGGAYTLLGQPLTLEGTASGNYGLIVSNGAHAVGSAVALNASSQVYVGNGASLTTAGLLDYLGNTTLTKRGAGEWVFQGRCAETNESAFLDVAGGTLRLAAGAVLTKRGGTRECFRVGYNGAARAVVESGATLNVAGFMLGEPAGSTGTLLVDGGTLTADTLSDTGALVGRKFAHEPDDRRRRSSRKCDAAFSRDYAVGEQCQLRAFDRGRRCLGDDRPQEFRQR